MFYNLNNKNMDLETFEKLVDEHLFILNKDNLSKKGASEFRIFGKEALYKQLMLCNCLGGNEVVCRSYYPNNLSTARECLYCNKGKHEH